MKRWILFALILCLVVAAAISKDSSYATPEAAKYADAAKQVLIRGLNAGISELTEPLDRADTVYVGYPDKADPPSEFLADLPMKNVVCLPYSRCPGKYYNDVARLTILKHFSDDSVVIQMSWALYALRHPDTTQVIAPMSPWGRLAMATVAPKGKSWEIVRWMNIPLM